MFIKSCLNCSFQLNCPIKPVNAFYSNAISEIRVVWLCLFSLLVLSDRVIAGSIIFLLVPIFAIIINCHHCYDHLDI